MMKCCVILVRPEDARNVGAVVRVAMNFGAASVRLVATRRWQADEDRLARIASAGAWEKFGGVQRFESLRDAGADCAALVATSARNRRGGIEPVALKDFFSRKERKEESIGLVFGPESQGLSAQEFEMCHSWIRISTSAKFPSLNLAQAVGIALYEAVNSARSRESAKPAAQSLDVGEQENFLTCWESQLLRRGALPRGRERQAVAQLRRLLHRAAPTCGDLALLERIGKNLSEGKK